MKNIISILLQITALVNTSKKCLNVSMFKCLNVSYVQSKMGRIRLQRKTGTAESGKQIYADFDNYTTNRIY